MCHGEVQNQLVRRKVVVRSVSHRTQESTDEKVVPLIESDMSPDGHQIDHNEEHGMNTVEEVLGPGDWIRTKSPTVSVSEGSRHTSTR